MTGSGAPERLVVILGTPMTVHSAGVYYMNLTISNAQSHLVVSIDTHTPRFIVRRKYSEMTTPNKFFIIESKDRIIRVEELRMKDHLHSVCTAIEELDPSDLVEDWIIAVIRHIVSDHRWERITLESKDSALK